MSEVLDTEHAVGTWNVLTQEERKVVGIFFPLDKKILAGPEDSTEAQESEEEEAAQQAEFVDVNVVQRGSSEKDK